MLGIIRSSIQAQESSPPTHPRLVWPELHARQLFGFTIQPQQHGAIVSPLEAHAGLTHLVGEDRIGTGGAVGDGEETPDDGGETSFSQVEASDRNQLDPPVCADLRFDHIAGLLRHEVGVLFLQAKDRPAMLRALCLDRDVYLGVLALYPSETIRMDNEPGQGYCRWL